MQQMPYTQPAPQTEGKELGLPHFAAAVIRAKEKYGEYGNGSHLATEYFM